MALAEDAGGDAKNSVALAEKLRIEERELEKQRRDIEALKAQLRELLAKAAPKHESASRQAVARKVSPPTSPVAIASPQQANDEAAVSLKTEQLQSDFLDAVRAGQVKSADASTLPSQPVGQQPEQEKKLPDATALPEEANLLAPPGSFIFTPSIEYTRSSTNALVFHGIEIVPGLQIGLVNASNVVDDVATATADFRAGLLDRLELEVKVPWVAHGDRGTNLQQQNTTSTGGATLTTTAAGYGLGDIEGSLRYQLNGDVQQDAPVYIASLRVKSNSGVGPFDVKFGTQPANLGDALTAPTGTGFWGVGPGFTVLVPTDPGLIFVNAAYLHNFGHDEEKSIGGNLVGNVQPGDSIQLGLGFGLAVNSKFSFSLGYSHTAILPTTEVTTAGKVRSDTLQAGQLLLGASYAVSPDFVINTQFEFGVTSDAPNMDVTFRVPMSLGTIE